MKSGKETFTDGRGVGRRVDWGLTRGICARVFRGKHWRFYIQSMAKSNFMISGVPFVCTVDSVESADSSFRPSKIRRTSGAGHS